MTAWTIDGIYNTIIENSARDRLLVGGATPASARIRDPVLLSLPYRRHSNHPHAPFVAFLQNLADAFFDPRDY
jgi:hypothetical protein